MRYLFLITSVTCFGLAGLFGYLNQSEDAVAQKVSLSSASLTDPLPLTSESAANRKILNR